MIMKKRNSNIPNYITVLRMAGTLCLLFICPQSSIFCVIYTLTGLTDVLDGWIARKTGSASEFGAKLDSLADLIFYAVMLIKIFPILWAELPVEIWYGVAAVLVLRFSAYLAAAVKYRRFAAVHTYMNKLTGAAVFCVPYVISLPIATPVCWAVCAVAAIASSEELLMHLCRQTYCANVQSIFERSRGDL